MSGLCVRVIINKRTFEPFMCLEAGSLECMPEDYGFESHQSHVRVFSPCTCVELRALVHKPIWEGTGWFGPQCQAIVHFEDFAH